MLPICVVKNLMMKVMVMTSTLKKSKFGKRRQRNNMTKIKASDLEKQWGEDLIKRGVLSDNNWYKKEVKRVLSLKKRLEEQVEIQRKYLVELNKRLGKI
jgi:hypothetical protein